MKESNQKNNSSSAILNENMTEELMSGVDNDMSSSDVDSDDKKSNSINKDQDNVSETESNSNIEKTTSEDCEDQKEYPKKRGRKPNKRGRKPKFSSNDSFSSSDESGSGSGNGKDLNSPEKKKLKEDLSKEQNYTLPKLLFNQLKKTGEHFLQDRPCFEIAPKLPKCRECQVVSNQKSNILCRFYAFRLLRYLKTGQLTTAGFSDPHKDAKQEDMDLWLPNPKSPPTDLDLEVARFTLIQVGDQFCNVLTQEEEEMKYQLSKGKSIAWKRVVQGVREMCDVCKTTLFNLHWACPRCGFVVCIDCYKSRKNRKLRKSSGANKKIYEMSWLSCTNDLAHDHEKLMPTQIIAGNSLMTLAKLAHESRAMWNIPMYCRCPLSTSVNVTSNNICKEILRNLKQKKSLKEPELLSNQIKSDNKDEGAKNEKDSAADDILSMLNRSSTDEYDSSDNDEDNSSALREVMNKPCEIGNYSSAIPSQPTPVNTKTVPRKLKSSKSKLESFDELLTVIGNDQNDNNDDFLTDNYFNGDSKNIELRFFVRNQASLSTRPDDVLPIRIMTLNDSQRLYPDVPHSWLCDGKLLRLLDPTHPGNNTIFQDQWRRGQPVIVSDVSKRLDSKLWHPDSFIEDFGEVKNDLINCMTGNIVPNQPMSKFWEGFEYLSRRLKDEKGNSMLLKLKDWPPGEDFAVMLPSRYNDLMNALPLREYTWRTGKLNLASRLPDCFVKPDLGPKMYNAYGSILYPNKGTTNLHLDVSDAVNVMVYVGIPKDDDREKHIKEVHRAIMEAGCDIITKQTVLAEGALPGALWHIYDARDADKIRDLLNKVAIEKGARLEPNHDPIHDQSWYLDEKLRERLLIEYSIEGYTIVQCQGDAVFIPAGAPHQVRNLHNCIKVAEDFVSPENVSHCFHLTQEFRDLSETHSNHEDKLQIKNIMYHAVKDSLSVLGAPLLENSNGGSSCSNVKEENNDESVRAQVETEAVVKIGPEGDA